MNETKHQLKKLSREPLAYIKEQYFKKLNNEELILEREKILKNQKKILQPLDKDVRMRSLATRPKTSNQEMMLKIKAFQEQKQKRERIVSCFYQDRSVVRSSILHIHKLLTGCKQIQNVFHKKWRFLIRIFKILKKIENQTTKIKLKRKEETENLKLVLYSFEKTISLIPGKSDTEKNGIENDFSRITQIQFFSKREQINNNAKKNVSNLFFKSLHMIIFDQRVGLALTKCIFIRFESV